jgi:hypothetical protein
MKYLLIIAIAIFGFATISMAQLPSYVPSNGLVGWWPFNGNANDESGNGNNGTVNGATLTADRFGNANSAYNFDGVDDYISGTSNNLNVVSTNRLSITSWINVNQFATAPAASKLITHTDASNIGQQYALSIGNDGSIYFLAGNGAFENNGPNISPAGQIQNNAWVHVAVVVSIDSVKLFFNGNMIMGKSENDNFPINPIDVFVFSSITNTTFNKLFNGSIDDVGVWNRALTQQEITDLYNSVDCSNNLTINPTNNQVQVGSTAIFSATTSDINPSFIWQSDFGQGYVTLNNYGNYSGVNTNSLSISNVQLSEHNQPIRVISTSGECIDTSNVATINITDTCIVTINDTITTLISVTDTLVINTLITGLTPPNNSNTIKVFPNPANSHITIDYGNFEFMNGYTLTITNSVGQTVYTTPINEQSSYIDLSTWGGNGIYFVQIIDTLNNTIENRKIVLQ